MERVQKIIARATGLSRRKAEELIEAGRVTVNGQVVALGATADAAADHVAVDGKPLKAPPAFEYILLNKPRGVLCTAADPTGRTMVQDCVKSRAKLYPVGRLDMNSTGLIILTNDGDLAYKVMKAGRHCPKVYLAKVAGVPSEEKLDRLRRGITLEDEHYAPCEIVARRSKEHSYTWLEVTLFQGRNRQIRKMFEAIHHPVFQLKRVAIGPLTDAGLPVGAFRALTESEVRRLKEFPVAGTREAVPGPGSAGRRPPGTRPAPERGRRSAGKSKAYVGKKSVPPPKPAGKPRPERGAKPAPKPGFATGPKPSRPPKPSGKPRPDRNARPAFKPRAAAPPKPVRKPKPPAGRRPARGRKSARNDE